MNIRILGLTDVLKEGDLDKGVKEDFPEAEAHYLSWPAATKKNILVFNNSGRAPNAVAEFTLGHMLAISRNISIQSRSIINFSPIEQTKIAGKMKLVKSGR